MPNTKELKDHLEELITISPALQSLTPDERRLRTSVMLSANEDAMKEFIEILEDEQKEVYKIEKDFEEKGNSLKGLIDEVEQIEKTIKREVIKEKEKVSRKEADKKAEALLKKLDEITDKEE